MALAVPMRYCPHPRPAFANGRFMSRQEFYLTTAISYPNGKPHIGHAYEMIASDAIARFHRRDGKDSERTG